MFFPLQRFKQIKAYEFCLAPWSASGGRKVETSVHENGHLSCLNWMTCSPYSVFSGGILVYLTGNKASMNSQRFWQCTHQHGMVTFTEVHTATKEDLEEQTDMNTGCSWDDCTVESFMVFLPCKWCTYLLHAINWINRPSCFKTLKPSPWHHIILLHAIFRIFLPGSQQAPGSTRAAVLLNRKSHRVLLNQTNIHRKSHPAPNLSCRNFFLEIVKSKYILIILWLYFNISGPDAPWPAIFAAVEDRAMTFFPRCNSSSRREEFDWNIAWTDSKSSFK